ncbi:MAG TPA: hypothetical protein VEZ20_14690 [Allosphingosinicella sp.]|nr:hypothetical protein [Allosphingosinicella sp.]
MRRALTALALAAALLLAACATPAPGGRSGSASLACPALPGADEILAMDDKRYILFGELHGTAETPELVGNFACLAARRGPVVLGLEMTADEQPALDAYLASDGSSAARAALVRGWHWGNSSGLDSEAIATLIERARALRSAGLPIRLLAFRAASTANGIGNEGERAMAAAWRASIAGNRRARLVALVGDAHAFRSASGTVEPAAMHLPQAEVFNLIAARVGGEAWNCIVPAGASQAGGGSELDCSPHPVPNAVPPVAPRGILPIVPQAPESRFFDRWYSPGRPFTASPPARPRTMR